MENWVIVSFHLHYITFMTCSILPKSPQENSKRPWVWQSCVAVLLQWFRGHLDWIQWIRSHWSASCIKLRRIGLPCIAWRGLQWCGGVVEKWVDAVVWWRCLVVWRCSGGGVVWQQWLWRCSRFCWISLSRSRALLLLWRCTTADLLFHQKTIIL